MIKVIVYFKEDSLFFPGGDNIGFVVSAAYAFTNSSGWVTYGAFPVSVTFSPRWSRHKIEEAILAAVIDFPATRSDIFDPAVWGNLSEKDIISLVSISIG